MWQKLWKRILRRKGVSLWTLPASLLWLGSLAYRAGYSAAQFFSAAPVSVGLPVISVGNLTVGGTGKTPIVGLLARRLAQKGFRIGIVSSGYGRTSREDILENGDQISRRKVAEVGDEVMLLARELPDSFFSVATSKLHAARCLARLGQVDLILVDDGYQHRQLHRDINILLWDASVRSQNLNLLPYGILREPISGASRADVIVVTRANLAPDLSQVQRDLKQLKSETPIFSAQFITRELVDHRDRLAVSYLADKSVLLFAGVAGFESLFRQVQSISGQLVYSLELADHQHYDSRLLEEIRQRAAQAHVDIIVTTGKDWVKIGDFDFGRPCYYLSLEIELDPGEEHLISSLVDSLNLKGTVR